MEFFIIPLQVGAGITSPAKITYKIEEGAKNTQVKFGLLPLTPQHVQRQITGFCRGASGASFLLSEKIWALMKSAFLSLKLPVRYIDYG